MERRGKRVKHDLVINNLTFDCMRETPYDLSEETPYEFSIKGILYVIYGHVSFNYVPFKIVCLVHCVACK